jgi:CHAD domain-containing protein
MTPREQTENQKLLLKYLTRQSKVISKLSPIENHQLTGKNIHACRVATRRAEAVFWILKQCASHLPFRKIRRDLHKLEKSLGRVRELDVAISGANAYGIKSGRLKDQRKIARRKLLRFVDSVSGKKLAKRFSAAQKIVHSNGLLNMVHVKGDLTEKMAHELVIPVHAENSLHKLRVTMKKVRYVLECMGKPVAPIKSLQSVLGEAHDLEVLQDLTEKNAEITAAQVALNKRAIRLIKPTLRFARNQLGKN